jgi:hypothetical protein
MGTRYLVGSALLLLLLGCSGGEANGAGDPAGACEAPAEALPEDTSAPDQVVGAGTADSCTGAAFVQAVARGGVITFDCGPDPVTIELTETAKVFNDRGPRVVIDGGNKVTLSGGGKVRILYQNTCDEAQVWTTSHCNDQPEPMLAVQNISFVDGNAKNEVGDETRGGGAIFVRGGRFKVNHARFFGNVCDDTGPDVGGGAIRAFDQSEQKPIYIVDSTFGGAAERGNVCSNGGALSSIGVSYTVLNSTFGYNRAIGKGANPAKNGTPGGGSGGAIYNDGNTYQLTLCGTRIEHNEANEGGGAIFFVSNDRSGSLVVRDSVLSDNASGQFETPGLPGIFMLAKGAPDLSGSTLE